jgi:hypothetical protein
MSVIYFLLFVGLCAVGLIWLGTRSGRKNRARAKSTRATAQHLRTPGQHPLLHSHANMQLNDRRDIWKPRRMHANEEHLGEGHLGEARWGGQTFLAKKVEFDEEVELEQDATGVTMPAIKYEPTEPGLPKTSTSKR